ncbi:hypothetical protein Ddye_024674 [Dipteronia dyeriana]|uniref:Reverse transcriptase zinc-binding domain-containing protein n=1 Tax=Dipteronia dyeriana TaxID=168575 RepID=A0AAD9TVG1_9ROSI|nr:hypothetical protein Ddye_024674 [Dipteronia dyeriana]
MKEDLNASLLRLVNRKLRNFLWIDLLKEGIWLIGENSHRDFWYDNWLGVPILELLGIPDYLATLLKARVSDFIYEALTQRLLLNRFPTKDRLCRAGFHLASWCSVCGVSSESSDHIFIRCPLAATLWKAVFSAFQRCISVDMWSSFFSQTMSVFCSNQECDLVTSGSQLDRSAALSSPGVGDYGGIFSNCRDFVKGCFAVPLDHAFAFEAELLAASMTINFAWQNGWHRIWLESDSSYVVQLLFSCSEQVPWRFQ